MRIEVLLQSILHTYGGNMKFYSILPQRYMFVLMFAILSLIGAQTFASSHREAPLISQDPLADNTDLYVFRSPDDPNTIVIIANYIPLELPEGGPT